MISLPIWIRHLGVLTYEDSACTDENDSGDGDQLSEIYQFNRRSGTKGASLILFPEIQLTPFFPQFKDENVSDYVMTIDDPYVEGICRACRKNRIFASPNIYIEENGKKYDMSLLINDEAGTIFLMFEIFQETMIMRMIN